MGWHAAQQGAKRGQAGSNNSDAAHSHGSDDPSRTTESLTAPCPGASRQPRSGGVVERRSSGPVLQRDTHGAGARRFSSSRSDRDQEKERPSGTGSLGKMGGRRHASHDGTGDARRQVGSLGDGAEVGGGSNKPAAASAPAGLTSRGLDTIQDGTSGGSSFLRVVGAQRGRARVMGGDADMTAFSADRGGDGRSSSAGAKRSRPGSFPMMCVGT